MIRKSKENKSQKRRRRHSIWNMSRAVKGSVTLLLTLMLMPMITFSVLIIDASRLQSARTNIAGAGELTLNAMMSEYNVLLEDMYGLFANCKDMESLKPALEAYFQQSAESFVPAGTLADNSYAQDMIKKATNLVLNNDGDISEDSLTDFLNMALVGGQFQAEGVHGGALANPNIMKQQIVEYMKYRGPISLASTLLGKIKTLSNASTQTDACDKKVDYNKSLGALKDPCNKAFEAIEKQYNMGALVMNKAMAQGIEGKIMKAINYLMGETNADIKGLDEIIARSKYAYENATIFYLLNAKSPFRDKGPDYNEMKKEALAATPVNYSDLDRLEYPNNVTAESATAKQKVEAYQATLNAIENEYTKLIQYDGGMGQYENDFDSIYLTKKPELSQNPISFSISVDDALDEEGNKIKDEEGNTVKIIEYYDAPVNKIGFVQADRTDSNTWGSRPSYYNLAKIDTPKGIAPWFYLFEENERAIDPSDSEIDKQIAYGKQMLDMQEEIKNDLKADGKEKSYSAGIKEYIIYKEEIDQLTKLYAKYAEKLNDRDLRKDYFLETVHEDVIKDNADKKEEELIGEMAEKWLTEGNDQFGAYMLTKAKMEACTSAMSKNEGEIKNWLSGAANNERFFLRYAHQYNEEAYSTLFILGMSLETMKEGLNTLNTSLGDILTKMEDIEKKKKAWKKSIDGVNSDSTKAAMLNDYNTAIDKLDKKEIEALKKIVTEELQPQVEKQLAMVKSVKYLGQQLYKVESAKKVMQQETNMRIEKKIEDKIKNKLLQGVLKDVGAKANEAIWKKIDADEKMPIFPDFSKNDTILNTPFDLKDDNSLKTAAQNLVKEHYDSSGFVIKDFKRFRVLDGINDKKKFSAYDADDMEAQDVIGKKENAKNGGSSDLLDQDEAFVITLYAEYKASQKAAKDNGGGGEGEGEVPKNADQAKLENSANKGRDDATNGEQPAVTQAGGQQQTVTTVTTVTEDFGSIMSGIKGYCKDNEEPTQETTPNCPNSSINNKKPADSSGGDGLKNAKAMLDKLADIGTVIVQNVYLEEYLTEMFTCRTDNQQLNKLTANPDKKVLPVVLLNGYTNENARKAYNNNANSGARTGRYINENTAWYGREIEYLLFGNTDLNANMLATDGTIFAIRFALNAIYAFTAPDIQAFALQIATAIAGWTVIGVPIVQACITILIALAESGYDIYLLHDGQNVAIYKNAATFVCSPSGFLKEVTEKAAETFINTVVDKVADKVEEELDKVVNDITQEVTDLSKKTVSDCADNLSDSVNKYAEQQKASLKTAVANMFVTPILNNIVPVESLIDAGDRYKTAVPSDLIEDAVRKAIEQVESTVSGMGDSAAKRVAKKLLDKSKEPMITNITAKLCSYFGVSGSEGAALPQGTGNQSLDELMTEMFIGKTGVVGLIDNVKDELDDEIKKVKDTINDNIDKYGDMAATNVKDFMHEQFASASEQISGSLKNAASNLTDKLPTGQSGNLDTSATSGGFSLNYKEYCKILMMIFICTSENQILQRAGVLVTANMRNPYPKNPNVNEAYMGTAKNFDLTKANTLFSVTAQVEMKTLFPWGVQVNQGEGNEDEGLKLDLSELGNNSIKINYCGINGY